MNNLKFLIITLSIFAFNIRGADMPQDSQQERITIDPLSGRSLYLELVHGNLKLGTATGFIIEWQQKYYLITNYHVVSGRDPNTNEIIDPYGNVPDKLLIWHHSNVLGNWLRKTEELYENGNKIWYEHPNGHNIDVIALPISYTKSDILIYPFDLGLANADMIPEVAMPVSIIGFPMGMSASGKFPIWKTGHIASEPLINLDSEPAFLIDATTRGGMSGSPVVLRLYGGYKTKSGSSMMVTSGVRTLFLGVYSGQWPHPEIGKVWKPIVINEILESIPLER